MSYIPKVGDDCLVKLQGMYEPVKVDIKFVSNEHIIFILDGVERCEYAKTGLFHPLKTPAEIEREEFIKEVGRRFNCFGKSNELIGIMYDAGYRKQQVKPLSKSYALQEIGLNDYGYKFMVDQGFIVQGGE